MKASFTRRLEALEKRLVPAQECDRPGCETEFSRSLLERLEAGDRKSTRLNSSNRCISYAVFCLKTKTLEWNERRKSDRGRGLDAVAGSRNGRFARYLDVDGDGIPYRTFFFK